jgi:hypothetical protein
LFNGIPLTANLDRNLTDIFGLYCSKFLLDVFLAQKDLDAADRKFEFLSHITPPPPTIPPLSILWWISPHFSKVLVPVAKEEFDVPTDVIEGEVKM